MCSSALAGRPSGRARRQDAHPPQPCRGGGSHCRSDPVVGVGPKSVRSSAGFGQNRLPVSQRLGNLGDLSHHVCFFIILNPPNPQTSPCVCGFAHKCCWKQTRCRMKLLGRTLSSLVHNGFVQVVQRLIVLLGGSLAQQGGEREKGTVPRKKDYRSAVPCPVQPSLEPGFHLPTWERLQTS